MTADWPFSSGNHANCHPCSTSFTSTSTRATINSSAQNFYKALFFSIDLICAEWLKAERQSWWQRTGLLLQPTTSGHKKSHSVICESSCIHLAFIRLVITGSWLAEAKNKHYLPWPLTLPTEYLPHFTQNTKINGAKTNMKGILENLFKNVGSNAENIWNAVQKIQWPHDTWQGNLG